MKYISIGLLAVGCVSCGVNIIMLPDETFENQYVSFKTPEKGWYNFGKGWRNKGNNKNYFIIIFNDTPSNGSLEITVVTGSIESAPYFDPEIDFESLYIDFKTNPKNIKRAKEQGIELVEYQTQYFQGMKCIGSVISRSYGGSLYNASSKDYSLSCGYYHEAEGTRRLSLSYRYYGAVGDSRLQKDSHIAKGDLPSLNEAEAVLKKDLIKVLDSIQLKDVDWGRMKKEGLIYNKPFQTIKW